MTTLDDRLIPRILSIVERLGKVVTFTVPASSTYNPATGATTVVSPVTHSKKVTPPEAYSAYHQNGSTILAGDMKVYLPASGLTWSPSVAMTVTVDGAVWKIVNMGPIYTGEQIALYELQLRK